jgi:AmmeMemoRadiSam system protein A
MGSQDYNTCNALADAIVNATKGKKTLMIASSDLSHYHNQETAEKLDNLVIDAIEKFDPELLYKRLASDSCEACGGAPIITTMIVAKRMGADKARVLIYGTSGDITGDYAQVVGYLSAVFFKGNEEGHKKVGIDLGFTEEEKKILKDIARKTVEAVVRGKKPPEFKDVPEKLKEPYGIFVTLTKHGNLRGCIGHIIADEPLYKICQEMAKAAALNDPRFNPVSEKELSDIEIEISVLTPMEKVKDFKDIIIGRDGLYIRRGYYSGLLLPQVATDYGWNVEEFLEQTCVKAGLPEDAYKLKDTEIYKFSAQIF